MEKVLSRLQMQCSKREYCSSDILLKARRLLDQDEAAAQEVLRSLIAEKYVDDLRYATSFAREKSRLGGWGNIKISYMLSAKGISKEVIEAALCEVDSHAAGHKMRTVLAGKYQSLAKDPQCRLKLLKFALSRGYDYETVSPVVDELINGREA